MQPQFNWLLVLVAGALILVFFSNFVIQYSKLAQEREDAKLALLIENQLDSFSNNLLHTNIDPDGIDYFNTRFSCKNKESYAGVDDFMVKTNEIIFAPKDIRADKLLLFVDKFELPYRVENIIFASARNIKYYFSKDLESLEKSLPRTFGTEKPFFNTEVFDKFGLNKIKDDIKKEALREAVFVLKDSDIDVEPAELTNLGVKIKTITIENANKDFGEFKQKTYEKQVDGIRVEESEGVWIKNLIFGPVFSDAYGCEFSKLIGQLENMNKLYMEKNLRLWGRSKTCGYELMVSTFDKTQEAIDAKDYEELLSSAELLGRQNKKLFENGCVELF